MSITLFKIKYQDCQIISKQNQLPWKSLKEPQREGPLSYRTIDYIVASFFSPHYQDHCFLFIQSLEIKNSRRESQQSILALHHPALSPPTSCELTSSDTGCASQTFHQCNKYLTYTQNSKGRKILISGSELQPMAGWFHFQVRVGNSITRGKAWWCKLLSSWWPAIRRKNTDKLPFKVTAAVTYSLNQALSSKSPFNSELSNE